MLHHRETIEIMVDISCLKLTEVPSQLPNQINVRYVDAKSRYVSTLKLMALLYGFPASSVTALDSPKIGKEIKLCYKYFKSRINNVPSKNSSNCCLIFPYLMEGFRWRNVTKCWLGDKNFPRRNLRDEYFYPMNIFTQQILSGGKGEIFGGKLRNFLNPSHEYSI